jgi:hypothetical protein
VDAGGVGAAEDLVAVGWSFGVEVEVGVGVGQWHVALRLLGRGPPRVGVAKLLRFSDLQI